KSGKGNDDPLPHAAAQLMGIGIQDFGRQLQFFLRESGKFEDRYSSNCSWNPQQRKIPIFLLLSNDSFALQNAFTFFDTAPI
ncbi:hypothetical protein NE462_27945, partial [Blautia hominis]|nr:hypothetical protein [Blautia hominis]